MNFARDHDELVRAKLATYHYVEEPDDNDFTRYVVLLDLLKRLVPRRRYKVHLSREIQANPKARELKSVLDEVIEQLRSGQSIAPYLSKAANDLTAQDGLLVHWGIHHLHLSPAASKGADGFVARADYLLFFRVDATNAYLIDIVPHKASALFVREELVRTVDRNWPALHHEIARSGAVPLRQLTDRENKSLRKKSTNTPVQTDSRIVIPAFGAMSSGHSLDAVMAADGTALELQRLELLIRINYAVWFGRTTDWVTALRLIETRDEGYVISDGSSGKVRFFERLA
ncbi:hypothetical protein [Variovorax sp. UC122_21]|uniref:hypothetical protein n=1 Tax=Variovorax sp. UC122_21 TaxID=3374554 RepID=UPI00375829E4